MNERDLRRLCERSGKALTGRTVVVHLGYDFELKSGNAISLSVANTSGYDFLRQLLFRLSGSERAVSEWLKYAELHEGEFRGDWLERRLKALAGYIRPKVKTEVERWKEEQIRKRSEWLRQWGRTENE